MNIEINDFADQFKSLRCCYNRNTTRTPVRIVHSHYSLTGVYRFEIFSEQNATSWQSSGDIPRDSKVPVASWSSASLSGGAVCHRGIGIVPVGVPSFSER